MEDGSIRIMFTEGKGRVRGLGAEVVQIAWCLSSRERGEAGCEEGGQEHDWGSIAIWSIQSERAGFGRLQAEAQRIPALSYILKLLAATKAQHARVIAVDMICHFLLASNGCRGCEYPSNRSDWLILAYGSWSMAYVSWLMAYGL